MLVSCRFTDFLMIQPLDVNIKGGHLHSFQCPCSAPLQDFQDFLRVRLALANEYKARNLENLELREKSSGTGSGTTTALARQRVLGYPGGACLKAVKGVLPGLRTPL